VAITPSLFDAPASQVLPGATDWITGTLLGSLAAGLCVIAVAFIGLRLMMGHLAIRDGLRVVIGCFVLLGAPLIASGLLNLTGQSEPPSRTAEAAPVLPKVSRAYDPYLGASIQSDGFQAPQQPVTGSSAD